MKLISELNEDVVCLQEERDGKKSFFIEGCFLQANVKNKNGRIYPMPILEREVTRYRSELIENKRAMGELGHPSGPGLNLDRVSHVVTECRRSGNDFVGKAKILDTPMGKIAESLLQSGVKLGVSSRGMGSLKQDKSSGAMMVQEDFRLAVMIDIVADPSAPSAWVNGVMEGVEWVQTPSGEWEQVSIDRIRASVHAAPSSILEETKVRLFNEHLESMMEGQIVDALMGSGATPAQAKDAVVKARAKARVTGQHRDSRLVYTLARQIVGSKR